MLDIGWSEMAIVAVIALFVIGPRELPRVLRTVGRYAAKIRGMAREFQDGIDEAVRETELDEVKKQIESARRIDVGKAIENTIDPDRKIGKAMDFSDAEGTTPAKGGGSADADPRPAPPEAKPEPKRTQGMSASVARAAPPPPPRSEPAELVESEASRADA